MRIIGGEFKGKKLSKFDKKIFDKSMRPTLDRVRESYFNSIFHNKYVDFKGLKILDLFAGTGANGLEAKSRGASFIVFVDKNSHSVQLIKKNVNMLGIKGDIKILKNDVTKLEKNYYDFSFDLVFMDPPYNENFFNSSLNSIIRGNWIKKDALIVLEGNRNLIIPGSFEIKKKLDFKKIKVFILRYLN